MFDKSVMWTIITAISVSSGALIVVAWLIRSIVVHWLSKDVEQFKATIKHEKDTEIEKLRVELNRVAAEHQIRFHQLHTKVFVTIARLYRLIVNTQMAMGGYFSIVTFSNGPTEEERGKTAGEAWNALNTFFKAHEIYFDKNICKAVGSYLTGSYDLFVRFQTRKEDGNYAKNWNEVWTGLNTDMENIKRDLEDSFRKKIGVES